MNQKVGSVLPFPGKVELHKSGEMKTVQEEFRKGPWTEREDCQLVCFVGLFGDRRWDFIAKVSGLKVAGDNNRTGKSCRLRWVNYLHPGLKRGKLTPQEERLVLELQSKWGNRWSRIARKLPGRTDNEIKNYWRTHMRRKAQERKRAMSPSSPSSNCSSASSNPSTDSIPSAETREESFNGTGGKAPASTEQKIKEIENCEEVYSMDDIWNALTEGKCITPVYDAYGHDGHNFSCPPVTSPSWECSSDTLWHMDEEESKMLLSMDNQLFSHCGIKESL